MLSLPPPHPFSRHFPCRLKQYPQPPQDDPPGLVRRAREVLLRSPSSIYIPMPPLWCLLVEVAMISKNLNQRATSHHLQRESGFLLYPIQSLTNLRFIGTSRYQSLLESASERRISKTKLRRRQKITTSLNTSDSPRGEIGARTPTRTTKNVSTRSFKHCWIDAPLPE